MRTGLFKAAVFNCCCPFTGEQEGGAGLVLVGFFSYIHIRWSGFMIVPEHLICPGPVG
jgi:hypothetical protein